MGQMQEKEENLTEDIINLKNEMDTKLDTKVGNVAWKEANDDLEAAIKTVRDMVSSLRLDVDARRRKVDEILATIRHDITAVETNAWYWPYSQSMIATSATAACSTDLSIFSGADAELAGGLATVTGYNYVI